MNALTDTLQVMSVRSFEVIRRKWRWWFATLVALIVSIAISVLLIRQQRLKASKSIRCVGNLTHIRLAKLVYQTDLGLADGQPITDAALSQSLSNNVGMPLEYYKCPSGGRYIIWELGINPECTFTNICVTYHFDIANLSFERRFWRHSIGSGTLHAPDFE